jgi:hypothetical protein
MAQVMAQVLQGQQQLHADLLAARTTTKTPRTVTEHFKQGRTNKQMILCDVVVETDLPDTWINLAANNGKRDREIIEFAFHSKATELHMQDWAPVVTPNLAKKTTTLRIIGSNMDDLDEGINPFSNVIVDKYHLTWQSSIPCSNQSGTKV